MIIFQDFMVLGHHLFQNSGEISEDYQVGGQYEMVKRLINTPFRRGWRALSAVLGASLPQFKS